MMPRVWFIKDDMVSIKSSNVPFPGAECWVPKAAYDKAIAILKSIVDYADQDTGSGSFIAKQGLKELGELEDYDPTPWCSACGAMTSKKCDCGPIAENE